MVMVAPTGHIQNFPFRFFFFCLFGVNGRAWIEVVIDFSIGAPEQKSVLLITEHSLSDAPG